MIDAAGGTFRTHFTAVAVTAARSAAMAPAAGTAGRQERPGGRASGPRARRFSGLDPGRRRP